MYAEELSSLNALSDRADAQTALTQSCFVDVFGILTETDFETSDKKCDGGTMLDL